VVVVVVVVVLVCGDAQLFTYVEICTVTYYICGAPGSVIGIVMSCDIQQAEIYSHLYVETERSAHKHMTDLSGRQTADATTVLCEMGIDGDEEKWEHAPASHRNRARLPFTGTCVSQLSCLVAFVLDIRQDNGPGIICG
jgi:hypothetical protein